MVKHSRATAATFAAVLSPLAGIVASLTGALPDPPAGSIPARRTPQGSQAHGKILPFSTRRRRAAAESPTVI